MNNFADASNIIESQTKINWFGTLRARSGYIPTERLMIYATGGLAYGGIKSKYSFSHAPVQDDPNNTDPDVSTYHSQGLNSKIKFGYSIGAGTEYALSDHWLLKGEYLYTSLGKDKLNINHDRFSTNITNKLNFHTVRVGINYKF